MKYSQDEIDLLVELRDAGHIGQRLGNIYRKTYPYRNDKSIRNKIFSLRCQRIIREKRVIK